MRKLICLAGLTIFLTNVLLAQDEGTIIKRERIERSQGIFVALGPSFTFGKNIGDYSTGLNIEGGYMKRLNRVFSIGGSLSYIKFKYDPEKTNAAGNGDDLFITQDPVSDINDWKENYNVPTDQEWYIGRLLTLKGGNVSLVSLALNLKVNFIPITDHTKISVYGFAKPFISYSKREEVSGSGARYVYEAYEDVPNNQLVYDSNDDTWYPDGDVDPWNAKDFPALKQETKITGGIFIGPGVEFMPAGKFSFFAQVSFGYTFPISYVSTEAYPKTGTSYLDDEFPIVTKGFPSANIQFGASFNF